MYQAKTVPTDKSVIDFIEGVQPEKRKQDAYTLLDFFQELTGFQGLMWGPSIIGFGSYHYVYATGHSGDAPLIGFSPRKSSLSLYMTTDEKIRSHYLNILGKHKTGKSCVYVNKLEDIDMKVLADFSKATIEYLSKLYPQ